MSNPATTSDIEDRWRTLTDAETVTAAALLDDAWAVISASLGDLEALMVLYPAAEGALRAVECSMVIRVMRNPGMYRSETVGAVSYTLSDAASSAGLFMTPAELRLVRLAFSMGAGTYSVPLLTPADASYPYVAP